jgi:putative membrane protein
MSRILLRIASLGLVFAASSAIAQNPMDPMAPTASSGQPNSPSQQRSSNMSMQDNTASPGMTGQMMQDKIFLRKATEGGLAEVQLGQLAAQKASNDDIKSFGQKMVADHTAINEKMKPIADAMGVMLPHRLNKMDQAELDKLSLLSGKDFDTEYLSNMVKDHHKDLHEFREEAANTTDPALKDTVTEAAQVIKQHSVMADKLARENGVPVPSHRPAQPPASQ